MARVVDSCGHATGITDYTRELKEQYTFIATLAVADLSIVVSMVHERTQALQHGTRKYTIATLQGSTIVTWNRIREQNSHRPKALASAKWYTRRARVATMRWGVSLHSRRGEPLADVDAVPVEGGESLVEAAEAELRVEVRVAPSHLQSVEWTSSWPVPVQQASCLAKAATTPSSAEQGRAWPRALRGVCQSSGTAVHVAHETV